MTGLRQDIRPTRQAYEIAKATAWSTFATPEARMRAIDVVGLWNRHACHLRGCSEAATTVYYRRQGNAHGGRSTFRYQRCDIHPLRKSDYAFVYDESAADGKGTPLTLLPHGNQP